MKKFIIITFISGLLMACSNTKSQQSDNQKRIAALKPIADSLYSTDQFIQASLYLDSLIMLDSLNGEYYFMRGECLGLLGNFYGSANDFTKCLTLNYKKADAYYWLGLNFSVANDSIAISYFEKCLKIDPLHTRAKEQLDSLRKKRKK